MLIYHIDNLQKHVLVMCIKESIQKLITSLLKFSLNGKIQGKIRSEKIKADASPRAKQNQLRIRKAHRTFCCFMIYFMAV